MLVFDTVIFALTLGKALYVGSSRRRTVVDVVLRDGTMYFGYVFCNSGRLGDIRLTRR